MIKRHSLSMTLDLGKIAEDSIMLGSTPTVVSSALMEAAPDRMPLAIFMSDFSSELETELLQGGSFCCPSQWKAAVTSYGWRIGCGNIYVELPVFGL